MRERPFPRGVEFLPHRGCYRASVWNRGKRITKCFPTVEEALAFRLAALRDIADGRMVLADGMTIAEWGRVWLPRRRLFESYANDRQRWHTHVLPALGVLPLVALTRRRVKAWLRELQAKPLAASTIRNCRSLLSVAMSDAFDDELVDGNPCADVSVDMPLPPISEDWYLSPDEQAIALAAAPEPERDIIAIAKGTGLRRGELFALHLADVHANDASPHLYVRYGGFKRGGALKTPKNGKARRVALFGLALDATRRWLEVLPRYAPKNPHALLVPHASGARRVYSRDLPLAWDFVRAALPRRVWWHMLRHTCASSLVAGWWGPKWSLEEVSKFLGHSSIGVTQRYAHLATSTIDEKAATMPSLTLVGGETPKLHCVPLSRPGDLNPQGAELCPGDLLIRERIVSERVLPLLRAIGAGDERAAKHLAILVAEHLPAALASRIRALV